MRNPHALIIDDNPNNLAILSELLSDEGVTSTHIEDPTQILTTLSQLEPIDLIFLDLEMPQVDGYEVLHILKQHLGDHIPIVACTVHTNEINHAHASGFHSFLGKPLRADRFPDQLQRILNNESVWEF